MTQFSTSPVNNDTTRCTAGVSDANWAARVSNQTQFVTMEMSERQVQARFDAVVTGRYVLQHKTLEVKHESPKRKPRPYYQRGRW